MKTGTSTATTLSAPGFTSGGTSITVGSTTNWPTDTGVIFAIDVAEIVDGEQVRVAGTYTEYQGTVASGTSITNMTLTLGTPQNYAAGSLTRVYIPVSSEHVERMVDGILADHSQSGGHEIATNFDPSNPTLETQKWVGVASAVNELTVTNAATGNKPKVSATGGDTNIGIDYQTKGSGVHQLLDGNGNEVIKTGAGVASAVNEVTVTNNSTGNAPKVEATGGDTNIGLNLVSKGTGEIQWNGTGVSGAWVSWTPTLTNFTGTVNVAVYKLIGKTCHFYLKITQGASVTGQHIFSLPVTAATNEPAGGLGGSNGNIIATGAIQDAGTGYFQGLGILQSTTTCGLVVVGAAATYGTLLASSATIPMVWAASNDTFVLHGTYEAA